MLKEELSNVFPVICYIKTRPDAKYSIVPEEGWFGQPKYSTRSKKHSTLCRFLPLYSSYLFARLTSAISPMVMVIQVIKVVEHPGINTV